jgi:hypothetical protein
MESDAIGGDFETNPTVTVWNGLNDFGQKQSRDLNEFLKDQSRGIQLCNKINNQKV